MREIRKTTFPGTKSAEAGAYEAEHRKLARRAAAEGIVLLKNEGQVLPLPEGKEIALFGAGVSRTVKGGTGSGDVNERESISILEGMRRAGYRIANPSWTEEYERQYRAAREQWKKEVLRKAAADPEHFFDAYASTPFTLPAGPAAEDSSADTAVYVLSRIAGEGADRRNAPGDYLLTEQEQTMLRDICRFYENVIVVINAGGLVDLSFADSCPNIRGLLQIVQPGMEGGNAVADVISGKKVPCGKLTDSWAFRYEDYPNAATFSHNSGNVREEYYREGIYVGYRYFDSFQMPVRYGFGYGLSYTEFEIALSDIRVRAGEKPEVTAAVRVTNTGKVYAGREVAQAYVSLPEGKLEKEFRRLCGFAKTRELAPGESQTVEITFGPERLASYDSSRSAWILEPGKYGIWIGNALESAQLAAVIRVKEEKILCRLDTICPPEECLQELSVSREARQARGEQWTALAEKLMLPERTLDLRGLETEIVDYSPDPEPEDEAAGIVRRLSAEQCIQLVVGDYQKGQGSNFGSAGVKVPGSAGETSSCALQEGIAGIVLADGPAGLRLNQKYTVQNGRIVPYSFAASLEHGFFCEDTQEEGETYYQYCTAIPVGTLLAQTWDVELLQEIGKMIGSEMRLFGVDLWLAPGMNIHRNPLCGRNFEYFSEDPLLSGKMAAAMTRGVQSVKGCGTTIKHFACNNQEDNRMGSNSIVSERALREIYLKGFEIAVREAQPRSIMTSYNLINGIHSANNYDLCTRAARREWKFEGMIMTDWTTTEQGPDCTAAGCMRAGNDLVMPGQLSDQENIRKELKTGTLTEQELRDCVTRLVRVILQSGQYI